MNAFTLLRYSVCLAAIAALGACTMGGSLQASGSSAAGTLPQSTASGQTMRSPYSPLGALNGPRRQPDHSRSWMSPDAKRHVLLYVGDEQTNDVYVYTYPMGKLVGTLTGFDLPLGECSDRAGNVWIADGLASQMVEYAHAGTTATATLGDPGQAPYGCAVDPKSGDLAVANYEPLPSGGPGSISVYAKAKGSPKVYADPNSANEMFVAYDENTLYVVGQTATFAYQLAAFANETFTDLTLSGATISTPGGVGLDNGLWIGDVGNGGSSSANIYQITVSGTTATVTGTTPLTNGDYCADELAHHGVALCTPGEGQYYVDSVLFYKYPAGGSPYKPVGNVDGAYGLAISR